MGRMGFMLAFAGAGGLAQLVDGTLGMGFGVTSATVLLLLGAAPAAAPARPPAARRGSARGRPPRWGVRTALSDRAALAGGCSGGRLGCHPRGQAADDARERAG